MGVSCTSRCIPGNIPEVVRRIVQTGKLGPAEAPPASLQPSPTLLAPLVFNGLTDRTCRLHRGPTICLAEVHPPGSASRRRTPQALKPMPSFLLSSAKESARLSPSPMPSTSALSRRDARRPANAVSLPRGPGGRAPLVRRGSGAAAAPPVRPKSRESTRTLSVGHAQRTGGGSL